MNRLKELREEKKMSQRTFAKSFNVSQGAVSGWETGRYDMSIEDMTRFAQFFDCSVDYLLGTSNLRKPNDRPVIAHEFDLETPNIEEMLEQRSNEAMAKTVYDIFKQMPPEMQKTALAQLRALAEMNKK